MTKKLKFEEKKDITIKFKEEYTINDVKYEKDSEHKLTLNKVDGEFDVKHDEELPSDKFEGKLKLTKAKNQNEEPKDVDVKIKGKFNKGYFWDSFEIDELAGTNSSYKIEKYSHRTGADLLGVNYWGWGGILIVLAAIIVAGYYWWTSYNKEEEEENI